MIIANSYPKGTLGMTVKSESMSAPGRCATCYLSDFNETWPVKRFYPKTQNDKLVLCFDLYGGR